MSMSQTPEISIVVPVFNESANLRTLHAEIARAMDAYGRSYEVVAVDDGSRDDSFAILQELHQTDPRVRVVRLMRNFGQHPALYAAFRSGGGGRKTARLSGDAGRHAAGHRGRAAGYRPDDGVQHHL